MSPHILEFIHQLTPQEIPEPVRQRARWLLVDLIGVACAGSQTDLARIACAHAHAQFGEGSGPGARLLMDGRRVSALGAAWAGGALMDSYDAHDGHALTKGHAGVVLLPSLLALCDSGSIAGSTEFMTQLVIGYEIATRAGMALHASQPVYHCSGAWNAVGVAAVASRALKLDRPSTSEALGIADYHAMRGLMLRGVDHPTMVKDGGGPGAFVGLQSALLAQSGFTGAPAASVSEPAAIWSDLGARWMVLDQYVKPYPVCRWAQPAIEAAVSLCDAHDVAVSQIERIVVDTFHEATRLDHASPVSTEQAQYSLPFPLAARLVHGDLSPERIGGEGLGDAATLDLAARIALVCDPDFDAGFPARRLARVRFEMRDGSRLESGTHEARGGPQAPLQDAEYIAKFMALADPVLGRAGAQQVLAASAKLWGDDAQALTSMRELCLQRRPG